RNGRDRAPGLRYAPHHDGGLDRGSRHRSVPRGPAVADPHHAVRVAEGRHLSNALPENWRRARRRPGSADRDFRGQQPDPGVENIPDPIDDAGRQGRRDGDVERRADGSGQKEARLSGRGIREGDRTNRLLSPSEATVFLPSNTCDWRSPRSSSRPACSTGPPRCSRSSAFLSGLSVARPKTTVLYSSGSVGARTPYLASPLRNNVSGNTRNDQSVA